jgi:hypothetical protein
MFREKSPRSSWLTGNYQRTGYGTTVEVDEHLRYRDIDPRVGSRLAKMSSSSDRAPWSRAMRPAHPGLTPLHEARALAAKGRYEEALTKHLWFHEHALDDGPGLAGVRLSFALSDWVALGKQYPPARDALIAMRDEKARAIESGAGSASWTLFNDVRAINGYLDEHPRTVALFLELDERNPEAARQCYSAAEEALVAAGEYEVCAQYLGDPVERFEAIRALREMQLEIASENPLLGSPQSGLRLHAETHFVKHTRRVLAILEGAGRTTEAEHILELARTVSKSIDDFPPDPTNPY